MFVFAQVQFAPTAFGAVFALVGLGLLVFAGRDALVALRLFRARTRKVSSLMGSLPKQVCLVGRAEVPDDGDDEWGESEDEDASDRGTVDAPFSGRASLVASYEVEERVRRYDSSDKTYKTEWKTVDSGRVTRPFVVDDGTARVRVDATGARLEVAADERTRIAGNRDPPGHIRSFVERAGATFDVGGLSLSTGSPRRYTERRIEPGDTVCVWGRPETAEGSVGELNVEIRSGTPFVVGDGNRRAVARRIAADSALLAVVGLVFSGVGAFVAYGAFTGSVTFT